MQKIKSNLYYEIIKAAENKKMFKTGIDKNLSEIIKSLGVGKKYLNKNEILMFSAIFRMSAVSSSGSDFSSKDIKKYYQMRERGWRKWLNIIYSLHEKGLIIILPFDRNWGRIIERINPLIFIDAIIFNKILNYEAGRNGKEKKLSTNSKIFELLDDIIKERNNQNATTIIRVKEELLRIYESIDDKSHFKKLIKDDTDEEIIFNLYLLRAYNKNSDLIKLDNIANFFDKKIWRKIEKKLSSEKLKFQKKKIITLVKKMIDPNNVSFIRLVKIEKNKINSILENKWEDEDIVSDIFTDVKLDFINSTMIYPKELEAEISRIKNALQEENYPEVKKKIKKLGHAGGLTFLLHGPSGTGKSRTVYEIAKDTGRRVLEVNLAQLRGNGLVGDGEREAKMLFEEYGRFAKIFKKTPILLINEADSIFSNRVTVNYSSDIGQNSQMNIVLDELDKFDGILFATTNLKDNFDSALDRRFIAKIEFPRPEREIRAIIWKQKLPNLNWKECKELSDYDFSGGIIENIAKKYTINNIFEMENFDFELLREMVNDEIRYRNLSVRKIKGFINTETA